MLYPQLGWRKLFVYYKLRLMRISATPHSIAFGFAIGAFISCTPLLGFHFILSTLIAWLTGSSILASFLGGFVGNPFTLPILWFTAYHLGLWMLGLHSDPASEQMARLLSEASLFHLFKQGVPTFFHHVLLPTLLGSLVVGSVVAVFCYAPAYYAVDAYQRRRRRLVSEASKNKNNQSRAPSGRMMTNISRPPRMDLWVNIDHVATLRNARGGSLPDPIEAARLCLAAGAKGITAHLREDRRHITDQDMQALADLGCPLNMEMALTPEMIEIALRLKPAMVCLVPEKRAELTTEGGLDLTQDSHRAWLKQGIEHLQSHAIPVSLFINTPIEAVEAAKSLGAWAVELHTGPLAEACQKDGPKSLEATKAWKACQAAAQKAHQCGLHVHAGHGLDYASAALIAKIPEITAVSIGHFLISEALFLGFDPTVKKMREALRR